MESLNSVSASSAWTLLSEYQLSRRSGKSSRSASNDGAYTLPVDAYSRRDTPARLASSAT